MQLGTVGNVAVTVGWLIAIVVLILAILGLVGVVPLDKNTIFGMLGALAICRLT